MKKLLLLLFLVLLLSALIFLSFKNNQKPNQKPLKVSQNKAMIKIKSPVFNQEEMIPEKYTCNGEDFNPPLLIENVPEEAKSLVLIVDDPDAPMGTFTHWLVWNIDPKIKEIKENSVPEGAVLGTNDFGKTAYGGPCPPFGTHRYYFKVYALDTVLDLPKGSNRLQLEKAMMGNVLDSGELMGKFSK
jgi:Raf kinase inhibitor-like YbhB/YbcL family protein